MEVLSELEKSIIKEQKRKFRKTRKKFRSSLKQFSKYLNSHIQNHQKIVKKFCKICTIIEDKMKIFVVLNRIPLFTAIFKEILLKVSFQLLRPHLKLFMELFYLSSFVCPYVHEKVFRNELQEYVLRGQEKLKFISNNDYRIFVKNSFKLLTMESQVILTFDGESCFKYKHITNTYCLWIDALLAQCPDVGIEMMLSWVKSVIYTLSKKKKKSSNANLNKHLEKVTKFFIDIMTSVLKLDNEEVDQLEEQLLEMLNSIMSDSLIKDSKVRASTLQLYNALYSASESSEVVEEKIFKKVLHKDGSKEMRTMAILILKLNIEDENNLLNAVTTNVEEIEKKKAKRKKYRKALVKTALRDPINGVRSIAVKIILEKMRFGYFSGEKKFLTFVKKKTRDRDHSIRLFVLNYLYDKCLFKNIEVLFEIVRGRVVDSNQKVAALAKKIFMEDIITETDAVDIMLNMKMEQLLRIKEVMKDFIEVLMERLGGINNRNVEEEENVENEENEERNCHEQPKEDLLKDKMDISQDELKFNSFTTEEDEERELLQNPNLDFNESFSDDDDIFEKPIV